MIIITDERCVQYHTPGHPERPERVARTLARLREEAGLVSRWDKPAGVDPGVLLRGHTAEHIQRLGNPHGDFDGDTPAYSGILEHAVRGVGGALRALEAARKGEMAFSLLRPPGHHATRSRAMGFCYLGTVALAALQARESGTKRVGILDFDVHHGNGTEAIVAGEPGIHFASIHQHPCYPGTGTSDVGGNCFNYPVAPAHPRTDYRKTIGRALERLLAQKPGLLVVSAGFDAFARDPIAHETLEVEDFHWIGSELRKRGVPFFSVLEGGYSEELPELVLAYLKGVSGR